MGNEVYANKLEVSCKAADGKSICAMPDVCMTPPQTPATPPGVPIPYPNTGMASDCSDGSSTVQVSGQEVMLKDKSSFKQSSGDEAGCAPMKGVITAKIRGKIYFAAWSMDVQFEGENVVRHMDLTTHNHGSTPNTGPWLYADRMAMSNIPGCAGERQRVKDACDPPDEKAKCPDASKVKDKKKRLTGARNSARQKLGEAYDKDPKYQKALANWNSEMNSFSAVVTKDPCQQAMRCLLSPYSPSKCCPGQTPHHLVEAASFFDKGRVGGAWKQSKPGETQYIGRALLGTEKYKANSAPCICVEGENPSQASHGLMHTAQNELTGNPETAPSSPPAYAAGLVSDECQTLETAEKNAAIAVNVVFASNGCEAGCITAQLKKYHEEQCGMAPGQPIRKVMA
jgi:hypothetical protein